MAARTRAAKASSAQIEKALTDFLGCARTNARARTLSEPEAARRAESAAALMEEEIAKDMTVVGCVCGAEGCGSGSTWRLDTRFGWFSAFAVGKLQRLAAVRFLCQVALPIFQSNPARAVLRILSTFASVPETPRGVYDQADSPAFSVCQEVSRLAGAQPVAIAVPARAVHHHGHRAEEYT